MGSRYGNPEFTPSHSSWKYGLACSWLVLVGLVVGFFSIKLMLEHSPLLLLGLLSTLGIVACVYTTLLAIKYIRDHPNKP